MHLRHGPFPVPPHLGLESRFPDFKILGYLPGLEGLTHSQNQFQSLEGIAIAPIRGIRGGTVIRHRNVPILADQRLQSLVFSVNSRRPSTNTRLSTPPQMRRSFPYFLRNATTSIPA